MAWTLSFLLIAVGFLGLAANAFGASRSAGTVLSSPLARVAAPFTGPLIVTVPPTVESVEPATGSTAGGTKVVITGTGFTEGSKVKIGGEATEVEVESETEIKAKTAAHAAGTVEIVVVAKGGTSTEGPEFTYIAPPKISGVTPAQGSTAGGTSIKIKGTGFREGSKVKIGAEAKSVAVVSETEITAKTAAHAAGKEEVVVTSAFGSSTGGPGFTYVKPPTVSEVEPAEGTTAGGASVAIKGTGFLKGATVTIGSAATSVVVVSETEITAKTAAHAAGKVPVAITESGLSSGSSVEYTFVAPPTVTSVSPAEGSTAGGSAIKVTGTGFTEKAKVKVGSTEATEVAVVSETEITAKTPAGSAGKAEVVVTDSKGTSSGGGSFTYVKPPTVTSVSPEEGSTLGGAAVKIKGTGFVKGATVTIGSAATSVVVVSETEITAKTAAHAAGKASVEVVVSGVKQSATVEYTYVTPPSVTKVEPATGSTAGGTKVVITGTGFTEGAKVKVGTAEASEVEVVSETEITAKTPAGAAGKAEVVVTDSKGTSSAGPSFTYVGPPSVTSVTPAEGSTAGGTVVKVKGAGFKEGSKVKVGSTEATEVKIVSEAEITAKTPAGSAGKSEVVVTDGFGASTGGPSFTYIKPPTVTEVAPAEGTTLGGVSVTIKGTGFLKGATVTIGSAATSVVVVSETEITAKTAAHAAGKAPVGVTVGGVSQGATVEYTYVAPPTVTSVSPAEGSTAGGSAIKVTGAGFTEKAKVKVGSTEATEVTVVSETEITAKTPVGSAGKAEVGVTDSKGTSSGGASFTYLKPPTVTSISPEEGSTLGGAAVKVKGTGFLKGATVTIGAAATSVVVVSETEITAKTAAHAAGKASVEVTESGVKQSATVEYTYVTPPSVTKVEPAEGSTAGGTKVVITGTGFTEGAKVKVGTAEASEVEVVSETEVTAKTPAGAAGKAEVVVIDGKGTSSGGSSFTYVAAPKVSGVAPTEGSTTGGTVVKIKGTGFLAGSKVKVGSTEATEVKIVSETEITAKTPAGAAGKAEVVVTDGFGASTGGPSFAYVKPPTVTEVEPAEGTTAGGASVAIKGTGFLKGATVTIGAAATSVVVVSETEITAKTAAHAAGKAPVVVAEGSVSSGSGVEYTFVAPPTVTSVSPAEGSTAGGTAVKVKGTGFTEKAKVKVGSTEATEVTVVSETEITAKTPAGAAGKAEVVVIDSKGTSSGGAGFTYVKPPTVTSVSPGEGSTLGGTAVKIKGTGFVKGATVTIGSAATSVVVVSETEITAKTAAHAAGKASVEVVVSGVKQSATVEYTYVAPPTVAKVEPAEGSTAGGTEVVITGTGFTEGAKVKVGTAEASEVEVVSETEITAKTPAGAAGKAEVVVTDSKGTSSAGASFTYVGPPSVTSVTPAEGSTAGGTVVKVKGTGFKTGSKVKVGSTEATEVKIVSEAEITAKTPAGSAGKSEVVVTDGFGASTGGPSFTYIKPPTVTEVAPAEGTTLGGASVTIKGTGFLKGATVTIGSAATSVVVVSETEITAKTAAHAAGKAPVEVTVSGVKQSATVEYTFVAPPTVTSVSPAEGSTAGGTAIKVKGTGFTEKAKVKLGSTEATEVTVVSETEITAKTPAGAAGKAEVVVIDSKGTSSAGAGFTYVKPPTVTSVSPEEGSTLGGTAVKIKGTGFVKGATVTIGSAATSVVVVSETEITAKTAAHAAGKAPVEVVVSGVKQSATIEYTYVTPPSVTKVEPAEGPTAGGTKVVITGTGFTEGAKVKVGTAEASEVEVESETEITAKTPAGAAGKAEVVVIDSKGTSSGGSSFTYVAAPKVSGVAPTEGSTAGGTAVTIKGTGFKAGSKVKVGSTEATEVKIVSETEITAKTPAGSAGKSEVVVTDGFGASTGGPSFTYIKPPTVTEITSASGTTAGGVSVTIKGTGFLKGATFTIGSAATGVVVVSETEITAKTAAHAAGKVSVEVTVSGVKQSATVEYTYVAPPTISKIEPASGPHAGGREIVLTGTGFTEGAKVKVGTSEATEVTVVSETEITARTPAGSAGKVEVTVTDSKGTSNAGTYTYT